MDQQIKRKENKMDTKDKIIMVLISPFMGAWSAFAFMKLWEWFLIPLHAPKIGILHAMGIMLIVGYFRYTPLDNSDKRGLGDRIIFGLILPPIILLNGYLIKCFM